MAILTKEDGTVVANANVYATVAEADAYHDAHGNTSWDEAGDDEKEAALLRATIGLDSKYRERWLGYKSNHNATTAPQFLAWPRKKDKAQSLANDYVLADMDKLVDYDGIEIDANSVPVEVQRAHMEVALIELTQRFVATELNRTNMVKYERVDVIETEYLRNAPATPHYPHIDQLLSSLASTAPVKLGADIGLTEAEQDEIADDASRSSALDRWFAAQRL